MGYPLVMEAASIAAFARGQFIHLMMMAVAKLTTFPVVQNVKD